MNCPFCKRLLYSRQHKECGYCGEELPEEFRLTEDEIEAMRAEKQAIEQRRMIAKEKEDAEREERKRRARRYRRPPFF